MNENLPILKYGEDQEIQLLNVPHARSVAQEVIEEDCYRFNQIPMKSFVVDIGAMYGEFAIAAFWKGHKVWAIEPNRNNFRIMSLNVELNGGPVDIVMGCFGIGPKNSLQTFMSNIEHPGGSRFAEFSKENTHCVYQPTPISEMYSVIKHAALEANDRPIFVKMDCEGMEQEIFKDERWIPLIHGISMEWHCYDGEKYAEILEKHGFTVELEGAGPPPRPKWDETIGAGLLHAKRSA